MVNAVSPENLQQLVEKLASFGTRHTLSDTLSDTRGIGAARRWIKAELERYARASGGRMRVEYDTYLQEGGVARVAADTEINNVMAVARGTDPTAQPVFLVRGTSAPRQSDIKRAAPADPGGKHSGSAHKT